MLDFPVDIVYTWVDGCDQKWLEKKQKALNEQSDLKSEEVTGSCMFVSRDELKYSLRSVEKHAPWIRKIFIVTDNQIPSWLNTDNDKIEIVDHKEIFKEDGKLPTFNSAAIGSQLHHIKGLSNNFLYFNDDVFLGRKAIRSDFFYKENLPKIFVGKKLAFVNQEILLDNNKLIRNNSYQYAILKSRKLVYDLTGIIVPYKIRHGIIPYNKQLMYKIETVFNDSINNTISNQFRNNEGVVMSSLFAFYSIANKINKPFYMKIYRGVYFKYSLQILRHRRDHIFIPLGKQLRRIREKFKAVIKYKPLMFCVNDEPNIELQKYELVKNFLHGVFREKSSYEN